jgi:hypothetical protein
VTNVHLWIGVGTALVLTIVCIFLTRLRAVNLRLQRLQAQIEEMHILTSRLLLRELNTPRDPQATAPPEQSPHKSADARQPPVSLGRDPELPSAGQQVGHQVRSRGP